MKCQFCGQELPDKAKFCFKCKKQIVCQRCGEKLIIGEQNIGANHIYTCYMDLGSKFPSNMRQSLADTKSRKGWIDTSNMNDIRVSTIGENAIIDLKK